MAAPASPSLAREAMRHLAAIRGESGLRGLYLALLASGSGLSVLFALLPAFAVTELGASTAQIGLYTTLTTLTGIPVALACGQLSERLRRKGVFAVVTTVWVFAGFMALGLVGSFVALLIVGLLFFTVTDTVNAQLLAASRLVARRIPGANEPAIVSTVRTAYSLGYVAGPLLAAVLLVLVDLRAALVCSGGVYVLSALVYRTARVREVNRPSAAGAEQAADEDGQRLDAAALRRLYWLACGLLLVFATPVVRSAYLLLFASQDLGIELAHMTIVIGVAPLVEIVLMPLCGVAAARWGGKRVVMAGAALAVLEMAMLSLATSIWHLVALQLAGAVVLACGVAVGMTLMQDLARTRMRFGTSLFLAARSAGGVLGGGVGGVLADQLGYRWMFLCAAACAGAGLLMVSVLRVPDEQQEKTAAKEAAAEAEEEPEPES